MTGLSDTEAKDFKNGTNYPRLKLGGSDSFGYRNFPIVNVQKRSARQANRKCVMSIMAYLRFLLSVLWQHRTAIAEAAIAETAQGRVYSPNIAVLLEVRVIKDAISKWKTQQAFERSLIRVQQAVGKELFASMMLAKYGLDPSNPDFSALARGIPSRSELSEEDVQNIKGAQGANQLAGILRQLQTAADEDVKGHELWNLSETEQPLTTYFETAKQLSGQALDKAAQRRLYEKENKATADYYGRERKINLAGKPVV